MYQIEFHDFFSICNGRMLLPLRLDKTKKNRLSATEVRNERNNLLAASKGMFELSTCKILIVDMHRFL